MPICPHPFAHAGTLAAVLISFALAVALPTAAVEMPPVTESLPAGGQLMPPDETSIPRMLQQRLEQLASDPMETIDREPLYATAYLLELYSKNRFQPLWTGPDAVSQLLGAIQAGDEEGLDPDDYHLQILSRLANEPLSGMSPMMRIDYDLLLSDAMILLGQHKRYGKVDANEVKEKHNLEATDPPIAPLDDYLTALRTGTVRSTLDNLSPHHQAYLNLKAALARYRQIASRGGWKQIPAGPAIKQGMRDSRVPALRQRLAATGDFHGRSSADSTLYDQELVKAVQAFQTRHHLEPDGAVGKITLQAMNITVEERISQIRVNLERTRWVIHDLPSSSLIIDIAGFMLQYYHDSTQVWTSKVMVGQPFHQTPVFRSAINSIVLNPTWTITPDIVKNETVPSIIKDVGFLQKQRLRILDSTGAEVDASTIPWKQYQGRYFPYTLRQDPGKDNSLGLIKFLFPNPYHVYLHDTPSKSLFGRSTRAFSHGCIRLQNPLELGRMIVANDPGNPTTQERFNSILASGRTTTVALKQPLPIYLIYLTTNVRDGMIMFKPDLYSRDPGVLTALNDPPAMIKPAVQMTDEKEQVGLRIEKLDQEDKLVQARQATPPLPNAKDTL